MIFFNRVNVKGESVGKNFKDEKEVEGLKKLETVSKDGSKLILYTDDQNLVKSKKVFTKILKACDVFFESMQRYFIEQFNLFTHDLKSTQGKLEQSIEGVVPNFLLSSAKTYQEQKKIALQIVEGNSSFVTDQLIYIQKRIMELNAYMLSFEILHLGNTIKINKSNLNVRKLILNVWHSFEEEFNEKNIKASFTFSNDFADKNKIYLDYKTFSAALHNLFDNTVKYILEDTQVEFSLIISKGRFELVIGMKSLEIEKHELPKLFDLGFRGNNSQEFDGQGVGMYIFKKAMELNGMEIRVISDKSTAQSVGDKQYTVNKFIISGVMK